jgi:deoxyribonuclease IV
MPLLGAHLSIAGGVHKAVLAAEALGADALQVFTKSPNQWNGPPLDPADVAAFRDALARSRVRHPTAHDSYLINLASPDDGLWRRSIAAFLDEIDRCEQLGLDYLVAHPGAHLGSGEEPGLRRVAAALDEVHTRRPQARVRVLLETTAGQGSTLGHRFEHLAQILERVKAPERLGVCLDTCHVEAAGYALFPESAYRATLEEFDRLIGLDRLRVFHVNDSLKPRGSRVDRHAHIGKGCLGLEPFRLLLNDARFQDRPMILETPKEGADGTEMDPVNLKTLRRLVRRNRSRTL